LAHIKEQSALPIWIITWTNLLSDLIEENLTLAESCFSAWFNTESLLLLYLEMKFAGVNPFS